MKKRIIISIVGFAIIIAMLVISFSSGFNLSVDASLGSKVIDKLKGSLISVVLFIILFLLYKHFKKKELIEDALREEEDEQDKLTINDKKEV